jgi:hypothetical protein
MIERKHIDHADPFRAWQMLLLLIKRQQTTMDDLTLAPMIPAGSIVQIDTRKREISPKKTGPMNFSGPSISLRPRTGMFAADANWMRTRSG